MTQSCLGISAGQPFKVSWLEPYINHLIGWFGNPLKYTQIGSYELDACFFKPSSLPRESWISLVLHSSWNSPNPNLQVSLQSKNGSRAWNNEHRSARTGVDSSLSAVFTNNACAVTAKKPYWNLLCHFQIFSQKTSNNTSSVPVIRF